MADFDRSILAEPPRIRASFVPHRLGMIELALFFAIAVAIEQLWLLPTTFASLQPHPYWLPVIALSLQYGTADGLLAAFLAIFISLMTGWPSQGVEEDYYAYVIRTWAEPVGWILVAIIVGEVRGRQRVNFARLERDLHETEHKATTIAAHCRELEGKIGRLERRLSVGDGQPIDGALLALSALKSAGVAGWPQCFKGAWRALLPAVEGTLYLRSGRTACLAARSKEADDRGAAPSASDPSALSRVLSSVLDEERSLSFQKPQDRAGLSAAAVFVALPIRLDAASAPMGALVIEAIDPKEASDELNLRLEFFAREVAHALAQRGYRDLVDASAGRIMLDPAIKGEPAPNQPVRLGEALQSVAAETASLASEGHRSTRRGGG
ncbi:MAG: hypothetical protein F9K44_03700 [Hyphomicrobiaceae bacterium]|nr:MAG: hypothetical protein F9K44_03700 [Hyphomicrobiaceae bacterium]